jgi:hypothetical protein
LPLGQLSPATIAQGLDALGALGELVEAKEARVAAAASARGARGIRAPAPPASERKKFQRLSGVYYTLIPHVSAIFISSVCIIERTR